MRTLTDTHIGLLKCAQQPGGTGMPAMDARGALLHGSFAELLAAGYVQLCARNDKFVTTRDGELALADAVARRGTTHA